MKKLLPIIIVLLIVTALVGGLLLFRKGKTGSRSAVTEILKEGEEKSHVGNLEKIMSLGVPFKCTWKRDDTYYGTAWVKGENSYSEITMQGKEARVINKGGCMWNWEEGNPQGVKICFDPAEITEESQVGSQEQMKPPADIDYHCSPAVFTESKFDPPSGVKFMDMDEMMMDEGAGE